MNLLRMIGIIVGSIIVLILGIVAYLQIRGDQPNDSKSKTDRKSKHRKDDVEKEEKKSDFVPPNIEEEEEEEEILWKASEFRKLDPIQYPNERKALRLEWHKKWPKRTHQDIQDVEKNLQNLFMFWTASTIPTRFGILNTGLKLIAYKDSMELIPGNIEDEVIPLLRRQYYHFFTVFPKSAFEECWKNWTEKLKSFAESKKVSEDVDQIKVLLEDLKKRISKHGREGVLPDENIRERQFWMCLFRAQRSFLVFFKPDVWQKEWSKYGDRNLTREQQFKKPDDIVHDLYDGLYYWTLTSILAPQFVTKMDKNKIQYTEEYIYTQDFWIIESTKLGEQHGWKLSALEQMCKDNIQMFKQKLTDPRYGRMVNNYVVFLDNQSEDSKRKFPDPEMEIMYKQQILNLKNFIEIYDAIDVVDADQIKHVTKFNNIVKTLKSKFSRQQTLSEEEKELANTLNSVKEKQFKGHIEETKGLHKPLNVAQLINEKKDYYNKTISQVDKVPNAHTQNYEQFVTIHGSHIPSVTRYMGFVTKDDPNEKYNAYLGNLSNFLASTVANNWSKFEDVEDIDRYLNNLAKFESEITEKYLVGIHDEKVISDTFLQHKLFGDALVQKSSKPSTLFQVKFFYFALEIMTKSAHSRVSDKHTKEKMRIRVTMFENTKKMINKAFNDTFFPKKK